METAQVPVWLETGVAATDAAGNVAQMAALAIGGWWTYKKFFQKREDRPRATLSHQVTHFDIDRDHRLVRVQEQVTNAGEVLLTLSKRETRIQQVFPIDEEAVGFLDAGEQEVPWPQLCPPHIVEDEDSPPEIEPGENDHFEHDFIIPADVEIVQIYSHFSNVSREEGDNRGWSQTTIHSLRDENRTQETIENLRAVEE